MMSSLAAEIFNAPLAGLTSEQLHKFAKQAAELEKQVAETGVVHEGDRIILPANPEKMTIPTAMTILAAREKAAQQEYDIQEIVEGFPLDAAAAFYRAVQKRYGFVNSVTVRKTDMWGRKHDVNPDMRQIRVGPKPKDIIQVPVGGFQLPGFDTPIESQLYTNWRTGKMYFMVTGKLKAKDRDVIREIITETRRELEENSIYKGRAIFLKSDEDGNVGDGNEPEFIDVSKIKPESLILSRDVETLLQHTLFTVIQKTDKCRKLNIPLKRTINLAGPYGTGKTLIASVTAKHCIAHGWTYVMVSNVAGLASALKFARRYQPAVVFAEDIDRATEERDETANTILNEIDGLLSKESEVITVLTTNHLDKITKAMLRPGRTDAIINVDAPDAEAAQRLVRLFAGKLVDKSVTLEKLGLEIKGYIPAVIGEIVQRSKLAMIERDDDKLIEADLLSAAFGMKIHAGLIAEKIPADGEISAHERLGLAFSEVMANGPLQGIHEKLDRIDDQL
jgi:transitional endoplasmic reticulum ATPase